MEPGGRQAFRSSLLTACGASGAVLEELLAYNQSPFDVGALGGLSLPLPDEPHLGAWQEYADEARRQGVLPALRRRLVQLRFPIQAGISQTDAYRAATRRGIPPGDDEPTLELTRPDALELALHPTPAGRVPLLVAGEREDFVALVRAFSGRNEPEVVPDSMGACIVSGLNNWDRVARHRAVFEAANDCAGDEAAWAEEFQRLVPRKDQYQDRFIILSRGPYSAVSAQDAGLPEAEWRSLSLAIRREHECTHYLTYRVFGRMRNNLLDELLADCAGLLRATGRYDGDLALRFFGLEAYPRYRSGGRLESYLGQPPLSPPAVEVVRTLVHRAVRGLAAFLSAHPPAGEAERGRFVLALAGLTLEELASPQLPERLPAGS